MKKALFGLCLVASLIAGMFAGSAAPARADIVNCFQSTYPCKLTYSGTINSATTTLLVAGSTIWNTYIWLAQWESTGTNATNFVQWLIGTGAGCVTVPFTPATIPAVPLAAPTANEEWLTGWGQGYGNGISSNVGMGGTGNQPFFIPANASGAINFCGQTTGTTTLGQFVTYSVQAPF